MLLTMKKGTHNDGEDTRNDRRTFAMKKFSPERKRNNYSTKWTNRLLRYRSQ
jgi:hypothetical protein